MEIRSQGEVVFSCPPLPWFTLPSVQPCIISLITAVHASLCTPHIFTPRLPAPDSCSSAALCRARNTASRWVMQNCKTGSSVRGCGTACTVYEWLDTEQGTVSSQTDTSRDTRHGGGELTLQISSDTDFADNPLDVSFEILCMIHVINPNFYSSHQTIVHH